MIILQRDQQRKVRLFYIDNQIYIEDYNYNEILKIDYKLDLSKNYLQCLIL